MITSRAARRITLHAVATAVLAGQAGCWCRDVPDDIESYDYDEIITEAQRLEQIRNSAQDEEERCEAACMMVADRDLDEVTHCRASGNNVAEDPWNEDNDEVEVICTGVKSYPGFCTGRRPQGHREADLAVVDAGTWFAVHAHLERASVTAFTELAAWLERRGAPAGLIERCRSAARDEVVHAELMTQLARAHEGRVPACESSAPSDALFEVALHNAVEGCVHEAFAAIVAQHQAAHAEDAAARAVFERIATDELRHGQLAWDLHDWLLAQMSAPQRSQIVQAQQRALAELPERALANARTTPVALGWPSPARARTMAEHFSGLLEPTRTVAA